jgi:hypothetical protein
LFRCDAAGSSCLSSHCGFSLIVTLSVILLQVLTHLLTPSLLYFFQQSAILSAELLLSWCLTSAVAEIRKIPRSQTPPSRSSSRNQRYTQEPNTPNQWLAKTLCTPKKHIRKSSQTKVCYLNLFQNSCFLQDKPCISSSATCSQKETKRISSTF